MVIETTLGVFPLVRILFSKINRSYAQTHSAFSSKFVIEFSGIINHLKYASTDPNFRMWETGSLTSHTVLSSLHYEGRAPVKKVKIQKDLDLGDAISVSFLIFLFYAV